MRRVIDRPPERTDALYPAVPVTAPETDRWYRLDNAAKIYPVLAPSRHVSSFRLSAEMIAPVDTEHLQKALDTILPRFPHFRMRLRRGVFWHYLDRCTDHPRIAEESRDPLRPWTRRERRSSLFRVRYWRNRISVEFFHALTDGYGGLVFLKTLIAAYLSFRGIERDGTDPMILDWHAKPPPEETEDAYRRFSRLRGGRRPVHGRAFHLSGTLAPVHRLDVIDGMISVDRITAVAAERKVSVTELLTAVLIESIYRIQQQGGYRTDDPVRVSVPINVRRFFPTRTLRNFALYANPEIEPALGVYTFDEILGLVHHFLRYTVNEKYLLSVISANVRPERSRLLRIAPLPLKVLILRLAYHFNGESRFSASLSNLGQIELPPSLRQEVQSLSFMLGPSRVNPVNIGVISVGNQLCVQCSSTMEETVLQRAFFRRLIRLGIPVRIRSNRTADPSPTKAQKR